MDRRPHITIHNWRRKPPLRLCMTKKLDICWCWIKCARCAQIRAVAITPYIIRGAGRLAGHAAVERPLQQMRAQGAAPQHPNWATRVRWPGHKGAIIPNYECVPAHRRLRSGLFCLGLLPLTRKADSAPRLAEGRSLTESGPGLGRRGLPLIGETARAPAPKPWPTLASH
jgi:hypothetical protein